MLCTITQFTDDLTPYLHTWYQTRTLAALGHIVEFIVSACVPDGPYDAWWGDERSWLLRQLLQWVRAPSTLAYVVALAGDAQVLNPEAYSRYVDDQFARKVHRTLGWLVTRAVRP